MNERVNRGRNRGRENEMKKITSVLYEIKEDRQGTKDERRERKK